VDRALKNDYCPTVFEFIKDEYKTFNDKQLIKAHNLLCRGERARRWDTDTNYRAEVQDLIIGNVLSGKFDIQRGNSLAMFAESFLISMDLNMKDSTKISEPLAIARQQMHISNPMHAKQAPEIALLYAKLVSCVDRMLPFYRYFFTYYQLNKKLVVLEFLAKNRVYDAVLFHQLVSQLKRVMESRAPGKAEAASWSSQYGGEERTLHQRLLRYTQRSHPIDNSLIDCFLKLFEVLEFNAEMLSYTVSTDRIHGTNWHPSRNDKAAKKDQLPASSPVHYTAYTPQDQAKSSYQPAQLDHDELRTLIEQLIAYIRLNPDILVLPYPHDTKRMNVMKLPFLLRVDPSNDQSSSKYNLRRHYFDQLADVLLDHFSQLLRPGESSPSKFCTWTLANHLLNNLDHEYTSPDKLATLACMLQNKLADDYEHCFEALMVKHLVIQKTSLKIAGTQFDQLQEVQAHLNKYLHTVKMTMELLIKQRADLAVRDSIRPDFLETYAKTVALQEIVKEYYVKYQAMHENYSNEGGIANDQPPKGESSEQAGDILGAGSDAIAKEKALGKAFDIDRENSVRNRHQMNSCLLQIGDMLEEVRGHEKEEKSGWLNFLERLHQVCQEDGAKRGAIISEAEELDRLRNDCYVIVAKMLKSQKAIERSGTSRLNYINPSIRWSQQRDGRDEHHEQKSGQLRTASEGFSPRDPGGVKNVRIAGVHNMLNEIGSPIDDAFMDNRQYAQIVRRQRSENEMELASLISLRPDMMAFLQPLCFDYVGGDDAHGRASEHP